MAQPDGRGIQRGTANKLYTPQGNANFQQIQAQLFANNRDITILIVGDSTGNETIEWVYLWLQKLAAKWTTHTWNYRLYNESNSNFDAAVTIATGTGSYTVTVYNCSVSGRTTDYMLGARYTAIRSLSIDHWIVSHGHNELATGGGGSEWSWRSRMMQLVYTLQRDWPGATGCLIGQNPRTDADPAPSDQAKRIRIYRELAQRSGVGFVDVWSVFMATGDPAAYIKSDGIHPTTSADAPAPNGSALWADTVWSYTSDYNPRVIQPLNPTTSPLMLTGKNLLTNGYFSTWTSYNPDGSTVPDGWTGSNISCVKDTTYYQTPSTGYSLNISRAATGSQSYITQSVTNYEVLRGRRVTLTAFVRLGNSSSSTQCRIEIDDGVTTTITPRSPNNNGGFLAQVISDVYIATNATRVRVRIYADTSTGSGGTDICIDRIILTVGTTPVGDGV